MTAKAIHFILNTYKNQSQGVLTTLLPDGRVTDVSGGTAVMKDREDT